jgi:glycosyltransferase involved in cell wall biosynthesis
VTADGLGSTPSSYQSPIEVALLRGVEGQLSSSVRQFADALQDGFHSRGDVTITPIEQAELGLAARSLPGGFASRWAAGVENVVDSFVSYPLSIRRARRIRQFQAYHVIDQWYAHLVASLPRERTIVSCQDLIMAKYPELPTAFRLPMRDRFRFALSMRTMNRAARVVCSSRATLNDLVRICKVDPERIRIVPKGFDPRMGPPATEAPAARSGDRSSHTILHVSSGWPYKNVAATIRVVAALRARDLDVSLVRCGVALTRDERALAERLRVLPWILDRGWVSVAELMTLYHRADVLLFPSIYEGFGRPPLEAMACGTPVVVSTAPALLELVGDAGLHADPNDVRRLADAVERVLVEPDLASELRARGLQRAAQYSWQRTVAAYAEIYREVIDAAPGGRSPSRRRTIG